MSSRAAIERFQSLAIEILADDDPRFQLPEKERFFANIHGHIPKYSSTLKQHVAETLAFLGSLGSRLIVSNSIDIEASVNRQTVLARLGKRMGCGCKSPRVNDLYHRHRRTNHSARGSKRRSLVRRARAARTVPYTNRAQFMQSLNVLADSEIADADRRCVSELLSKQINRHRHFQDSHWSIPVDTLDGLELVLDKLKPSSSVLRNAWLFAQWPDRFFDGKGTVEESEKALEVARTNAIREILSEEGFSGIEQLSELAESAYTVGWSLANATDGQFFALMIPAKIGGLPKERDLAGGFIWKQYWPDDWEWIDTALQQCSDDRAAANLLLALRFHPNVWERAGTRGDDVSETYWKECRLPALGKMGRSMNSNSKIGVHRHANSQSHRAG